MAPFKEEVLNIIIDGQATGAFCVVPGEVDADELGAGPVLGDFIMIEEDVANVAGVAFCRRILCQSRRRLGRRGLGATCGAIGLGW